ncbi:hypothetical protein [Ureibacillus acetophenoni]|uniref:Uncharacterized protein n=1 Tax=Ureibacillus acetophenoni TaxID=614649 RepID=A0A285U3D3_9BACL|nr:hypothetical protein [Ureibacillus acetophenoni]SOC36454.1 hypothetical protein SAMN05877842_102374 [Ureibacillus acetophenoni]
MVDLIATLVEFLVIGGIILLFSMWSVSLIKLIFRKSNNIYRWFKLSPEKRKNNRKMNKTVKRMRRKSKYNSGYGDGGYAPSSYSSGDSGGDGGGGCD